MKDNREILKASKKALDYTRGELLGISFIAILFGGISLFPFYIMQIIMIILSHNLTEGNYGAFAQWFRYLYLGLALYTIVALFLGSFVEIGLDRVMLMKIKGHKADKGTLFYYRPVIIDTLFLRLLSTLKVTLWSFLLIVPGIIAILNYSLAPFVFAQDPRMPAPEAIRMSKYLMNGYKWKLTKLVLRFSDEIIISILLFGIPFFYVMPRIRCAVAAFYVERIRAHNEEVKSINDAAIRNGIKEGNNGCKRDPERSGSDQHYPG